jgi:hypothetical protein
VLPFYAIYVRLDAASADDFRRYKYKGDEIEKFLKYLDHLSESPPSVPENLILFTLGDSDPEHQCRIIHSGKFADCRSFNFRRQPECPKGVEAV